MDDAFPESPILPKFGPEHLRPETTLAGLSKSSAQRDAATHNRKERRKNEALERKLSNAASRQSVPNRSEERDDVVALTEAAAERVGEDPAVDDRTTLGSADGPAVGTPPEPAAAEELGPSSVVSEAAVGAEGADRPGA